MIIAIFIHSEADSLGLSLSDCSNNTQHTLASLLDMRACPILITASVLRPDQERNFTPMQTSFFKPKIKQAVLIRVLPPKEIVLETLKHAHGSMSLNTWLRLTTCYVFYWKVYLWHPLDPLKVVTSITASCETWDSTQRHVTPGGEERLRHKKCSLFNNARILPCLTTDTLPVLLLDQSWINVRVPAACLYLI